MVMSLTNFGDQRGLLFHAMPTRPVGSEIRASTLYGTRIPDNVRERFGLDEVQNPPLVFASDHITKALAFGLHKELDHPLYNCDIPETPYEACVLGNRDETMSRQRDGAVFVFSGENFVELPNAPRQSFLWNPCRLVKLEKF